MTDLTGQFPDIFKRLAGDEKVLLAVSGGVDSMVLFHLCVRHAIPCVVLHCNFQLRGEESDADAFFVKNAAETAGVPFYLKSFETAEMAEASGLSIQMAARDLRYQWFVEMADELNINVLATAHHQNDCAETILINLMRGAGLPGLAGIPESILRAGGRLKVIRPLLGFSKDDIRTWAEAEGIAWREDSSNVKTDYTRNYVRHRIIPVMEDVQPALLQQIQKSGSNLQQTYANYMFLLQQQVAFQQTGPYSFQMNIDPLKQTPAPAGAIYDLLKNYGFTPEQARQTAALLDKTGQEIVSDSGNRLFIDRQKILLELKNSAPVNTTVHIQPDDLMVRLPDSSRLIFTQSLPQDNYPDGTATIVVDETKLQYPLQVRRWQAGDYFQPFGMEGRGRKIQDFLTDLKVARPEKERVLLLLNGNGDTIWVLGYRLDERFKIEKSSEKWLKISWIKP